MKTYTAKNLDEALKAAAEDKNVMISDLTYTVVEESNGFLGIGSKTTISAYCKKDICVFMKEYLQNILMELVCRLMLKSVNKMISIKLH